MIRQIDDPQQKNNIARDILYALPEWFGIPESTETYIRESAVQTMVASLDGDRANGFLCLKQTGRDTVELAVMGVRKELHRRGTGRGLFEAAKRPSLFRRAIPLCRSRPCGWGSMRNTTKRTVSI